jgi:hypothetical protein
MSLCSTVIVLWRLHGEIYGSTESIYLGKLKKKCCSVQLFLPVHTYIMNKGSLISTCLTAKVRYPTGGGTFSN